ncbi:MAG: heme-binding protein, partial [Burkholderiaceae bacterium]
AAKTRPAIVTLPNGVLLQGGVPISVNGQTVGAIGVSGVTSQQDEQIAEAGIRTAGFSQ